jgi:hypothetical protein
MYPPPQPPGSHPNPWIPPHPLDPTPPPGSHPNPTPPNPTPPSKALKIIRYTSRLIAALSPEGSEARRRFDLLQANVGNSRCVFGSELSAAGSPSASGYPSPLYTGSPTNVSKLCPQPAPPPQTHPHTNAPKQRIIQPDENRKAYRLGKFLQNVHGFRRSAFWLGAPRPAGRADAMLAALEAVTYVGEGVYYFIDQFIW